jgi:hypothetical protein
MIVWAGNASAIAAAYRSLLALRRPESGSADSSAAPAGQGPTKAHRIHLKHVIKQFRACEKRLASLLAKHSGPFLEILANVRSELGIATSLLPCFSMLLETSDGRPLVAALGSEVRCRLPARFCRRPAVAASHRQR